MTDDFLEEFSFGVLPCKKEINHWFFFLVQHKKGGHWSFPKGHKEGKETDKQAAFRELLEETCLKEKKLLKEEPFSESYTLFREGRKIYKTVFYFLAEVKGNPSLQKEEIVQGRWFSIKEAEEKITFLQSRELLQKALFYLSSS